MNENSEKVKAGSQQAAEGETASQNVEPTNPTLDNPDQAKTQTTKPLTQKPEDKPFQVFIRDDLLPDIYQALTQRGLQVSTMELIQGERPVVGGTCWMVFGAMAPDRHFWLCFASDSITSKKTISLAESGTDPSVLEPFLIDEKKITLKLLRSRLMQRLNGQKWLGAN